MKLDLRTLNRIQKPHQPVNQRARKGDSRRTDVLVRLNSTPKMPFVVALKNEDEGATGAAFLR